MLVLEVSQFLMENITKAGSNYLVGYDWNVGDFTLSFYYSDFDAHDAKGGETSDEDAAIFSISY